MTQLHYRLVNVFTRDGAPLSGNPLCVFEDGRGLDTATMQALARQFNLSETTFILPSGQADAQVRIFTPGYEMPFAGHPTLGTAHVCRQLGLGGAQMRLEMRAGVIPVQYRESRWTLQAPAPTSRPCDLDNATLAAMLGLAEADVEGPALWVSTGREQLMLALRSVQAVQRAVARPELFQALHAEHGPGQIYLFAAEANRRLARFFFPRGTAVLEDPATGSAAANLGGWLLATGHRLPCALEIHQGAQLQRPSTLWLQVGADRTIQVGGEVIELGRGSVWLAGHS